MDSVFITTKCTNADKTLHMNHKFNGRHLKKIFISPMFALNVYYLRSRCLGFFLDEVTFT
jgi:hypothetical protein